MSISFNSSHRASGTSARFETGSHSSPRSTIAALSRRQHAATEAPPITPRSIINLLSRTAPNTSTQQLETGHRSFSTNRTIVSLSDRSSATTSERRYTTPRSTMRRLSRRTSHIATPLAADPQSSSPRRTIVSSNRSAATTSERRYTTPRSTMRRLSRRTSHTATLLAADPQSPSPRRTIVSLSGGSSATPEQPNTPRSIMKRLSMSAPNRRVEDLVASLQSDASTQADTRIPKKVTFNTRKTVYRYSPDQAISYESIAPKLVDKSCWQSVMDSIAKVWNAIYLFFAHLFCCKE